MAKKILSFEEYSKKVDAPDVSEETKDEEVVTTEGEDNSKSVAEMLKEVYEAAYNEAKAYEGDDYQEHTVESYMKEMAALNAGMMAEMYEASCNEVKEEEMTVEMYEAACNSMKEAYAKKMDEMMESYSSDSNLDSKKDI